MSNQSKASRTRVCRYSVQCKAHSELLAGFEAELEALGGTELHPAACTPGQTRLVHLVNAPRLREWAAECQTCHHSLAQKVSTPCFPFQCLILGRSTMFSGLKLVFFF